MRNSFLELLQKLVGRKVRQNGQLFTVKAVEPRNGKTGWFLVTFEEGGCKEITAFHDLDVVELPIPPMPEERCLVM